ncbi:hypothetical protein D9615_007068 [Tricholomella constricta]|uniref:Transmembrane protein n=1 Tax=Tricholomella constricta TaxID=117010 RepID=A0A8H5H841_9AGAR|nr:hypothetical protein D9615_007068 [Tricholomella constricta]
MSSTSITGKFEHQPMALPQLANMVSILIDSFSKSISLPPGSGIQQGVGFRDSSLIGGSGIGNSVGFTVTFEGISIAIFGSAKNQLALSLDEGEKTILHVLKNSSVHELYRSPTLQSGTHHVTLYNPSHSIVWFYYALVTPGNDTQVSDKRLVVDDNDPSIEYEGNWATSNTVISSTTGDFHPFGGTTHDAQIGASAKFYFTGTSVFVYGPSKSGLQATFSLDGDPRAVASIDAQLWTSLWYSVDGLDPGNHTLTMQMIKQGRHGELFSLDYIMYTPSFHSLATKPEPLLRSSSSSSSSVSTSTSTMTPHAGHTPTRHSAIIGAVLGAIAVILLAGFIWWKCVSKSIVPKLIPFPSTEQRTGTTYGNGTAEKLTMRSRPMADQSASPEDPPSRSGGTPGGDAEVFIPQQSLTFMQQVRGAFSLQTRAIIEPFPLHLSQENPSSTAHKKPLPTPPESSRAQQRLEHGNVIDIGADNSQERPSKTRVRELVNELQRELAVTSMQGRNALLGLLLNQDVGVNGRYREHSLLDNRSVAASSLPPPYDVQLDRQIPPTPTAERS